ncbi:MAG TPA: biotin carboxyl carrier domain-containing protein [Candidatus Ignatzschineria merdigallinarum]|uniref:Biotin carboxyl carrier protein of acetyl-CoA carboxylase n=1 Tax=Candidatus Ignatzschineria merdigallinarum TaxID=2838621 RepID=A0A9D1Q7X3_9GAMM|nr:biotin carboxyl carrier domain-containing protein [Candidatus Ignatzschineria merdigallinarum]
MEILSPMPGVFYRRPSPESPCYVEVGQAVKIGDVLGLIEVMKQYSELTAEADGTITAILVEDGDAVEAGQTIIVIG